LKVLYSSGYAENAILHEGLLDKDVQFLGKPTRGGNWQQESGDSQWKLARLEEEGPNATQTHSHLDDDAAVGQTIQWIAESLGFEAEF